MKTHYDSILRSKHFYQNRDSFLFLAWKYNLFPDCWFPFWNINISIVFQMQLYAFPTAPAEFLSIKQIVCYHIRVIDDRDTTKT